MKAVFKKLFTNKVTHHQERQASPRQVAKVGTSTSQKSNRATIGTSRSRSVPELTDYQERQASPRQVAKVGTSTSQKSNRATRGTSRSRSVPELTDYAIEITEPVKSYLQVAPAKIATQIRLRKRDLRKTTHGQKEMRKTTRLPPLNILNVLTTDNIENILGYVAFHNSQLIVLNNDFLKFYITTTNKLKDFDRNILDTKLLSNLHTIYLDNLVITYEIIDILKKTLTYSKIITIILSNITIKDDAIVIFTDYLDKNNSILNLIIRNMPLSKENLLKLILSIRNLKTLVLLEFSGFDVRDLHTVNGFTFDDHFINLIIFLSNLQYLIFNKNIIEEDNYRRLFISSYATNAPSTHISDDDKYSMYLKGGYMKFYDTGNFIPSYFFELIRFTYKKNDMIKLPYNINIYRDIFFSTFGNMSIVNGINIFFSEFKSNPMINKYTDDISQKYPKNIVVPFRVKLR
jgi:hypothetical protein